MPLADTLHAVTTVYRKGLESTRRDINGILVTDVYGYPPIPTGIEVVDMHFVAVAVFKDQALIAWPEIEKSLIAYPNPERLDSGPSYIELAWSLGIEQETAFRLMAIGAALRKWTIITPATFGIEGPSADDLAGKGMVMISGWPSRARPELSRDDDGRSSVVSIEDDKGGDGGTTSPTEVWNH